MIVVTGTKRSGTSMWMRLLQAGGFPVIGTKFPGQWGETIRDANPDGFYESILRGGIYYRTNPHPRTGDFLAPRDTRRHAVKVFIPGLLRSDLAFLDKVVGTMRPWHEYHRSIERLYAMEEAALVEKHGERPAPVRITPVLEWWAECFSLVSDALTRRYPLHLVSYDEVLADPERVITETFGWLGDGDARAAIAVVDPAARTQRAPRESVDVDLEPAHLAVFDELYDHVRRRQPLELPFIDRLNATHAALEPRIRESMKGAARDMLARRRGQSAK